MNLKRDHDKNDAAPVEIGLVAAGFILFVRVAIGLRHKEYGILTPGEQVTMNRLAMQKGRSSVLRSYG